ncbi:sterol 3-beta-glucosyltransferase UGT80B1 isoform X1 [Momordica charantia]|uniref:Sterol 3-beta-glucosyltransferase UGT80B1 isoform X1 n=1 Tax=Momordica charantia TaxID=3673 RepID=A0A6J1C025_MOMCH|nr:sterol 3-beta-glucosyltransferase UGT80B1 isoform X1 [Momordica charantia]
MLLTQCLLSVGWKKQLIADLVKIQHDGTVEVDIEKNSPAASELLKLHPALEGTSVRVDGVISDSVKLIPRLKIAILVVGTRGDVQPFLAIAKKLQEFGHHVRLATHTNFSNFVKSAAVDFYPLGGDSRDLAEYMTRNKGFIPSGPGEISLGRKHLNVVIESILPACTEPDLETGTPFMAQAIIANPPAYGHTDVAEALRVPLHFFFTMPWTPTNEFPHPLARVPQNTGHWLSFIVVELLIWWGRRRCINDFRSKKLKLAPISYFSTYRRSISHLPTTYMWSPHVVPKPKDWGPSVDVVGYCFMDLGSKYQPEDVVIQWMQKGTKPIYIGFGSMPLAEPKRTTDIILEALKDTGQRGIIDHGSGNLGTCTEVPENVLLVQDYPHDWLFLQCLAVVHHGGAGTTSTGLKAGCPTTIVPFFGDQFFWGERIHQKGLGPAPIPISQLNSANLSNAIRFMLQSEVKCRAMEIAELIQSEDGVVAAVDAFHHHLPPELPIPPPSIEEQELASPLQWVLLQIEKWCCLPCGLRL